MFQIGPYSIDSHTVLAPMAGVTDQPFRRLCRRLGAGFAVSEMVIADSRLWNSRKSALRLNHSGEQEPRSVQIAGGDPDMLAEAARLNVERGAQIIDINMGCPAKKVCNKAAGSALLKDEALVHDILRAVTAAVTVPVTLKIRTGWSPENKNALTIARMAEDCGISALAVHGRTRACKYQGDAEYETIARVREVIDIPLFANGDITSPEKAAHVLALTGADAVMIGRQAQGNPWIFREIEHFIRQGTHLPRPSAKEIQTTLMNHLCELHQFYGEHLGVRIARKHVGWYLQHQPDSVSFRAHFNQLETAVDQVAALEHYFVHAQDAFVAA